jgi:crossover junction endodeoxyribonuclease RuvC
VRVLGIDPGMQRLGVAFVEDGQLTSIGTIGYRLDGRLTFNENLNAALDVLYGAFSPILRNRRPDEAAAEIVPLGHRLHNSEVLCGLISVCKVMCRMNGIPWADYGANTVKKEVAGDGRASKAAVRAAIFAEWPEWKLRDAEFRDRERSEGALHPKGYPWDAWDAAAVALTHTRRQGPDA